MFEHFNTLTTKDGKPYDDVNMFITNRFVSFAYPKFSVRMNKYVFALPDEFLFKVYDIIIPKKKIFIEYIKKPEASEEEFDFLFSKIRKYHNMSDADFHVNKKIYLELFKDRKILEEYFNFYGVEKERFEEYGFTISRKVIVKHNFW